MEITPMLTVSEFSRLAKIPEQRVRQLCREGQVKARKFGKTWRISASELA